MWERGLLWGESSFFLETVQEMEDTVRRRGYGDKDTRNGWYTCSKGRHNFPQRLLARFPHLNGWPPWIDAVGRKSVLNLL